MVIKAGEGTIECGGAAMSDEKQQRGDPAAARANGTLIGKRYVDYAFIIPTMG